MSWLKQSTAVTVKIGPFMDEDGVTAATALTLTQADIRLSKGGGNMAQKTSASACTHDELGVYDCPLDATDTGTLGRLDLFVHETGALPVYLSFMVVPANVWDSLFGADRLQVHTAEITDALISSTTLNDGAITGDTLASTAVAEIVSGVWDALLASHTVSGSAGEKLGDLENTSDPWGTALPGAYGAGTAGKVLGDKAFNASQIGGSTAAADNLARGGLGLVRGRFVTGSLSAANGTTDLTGWGDDTFNGRILTITTGARAGEQRAITDHVETNGVLMFAALTGAPANNDEFFIA